MFTEDDKVTLRGLTNPSKRIFGMLEIAFIKLYNLLNGKVNRPAATDNKVVRFDGIDGSIQDSSVTITDAGEVLVNTSSVLPDSTPNHKMHIDGYVKHKYGWKDNVVQITPELGDRTRWKDIGNGIYAMQFTAGDFVTANYHVNHDYAEGTDAYIHAHVVCASAQQAGAKLTILVDYLIARGHSQGESLTAPTTQIEMEYIFTGNEVAGEHLVIECGDDQAFDLLEPDAIMCCKLGLGSETVTGSVYVMTLDIHYQSSGEVTLNKEPSFYI